MNTFAGRLPGIDGELPGIALIGRVLAPAVCGATLLLCILLYSEPLSAQYGLLASISILLVLEVFGELPLAPAQGRIRAAAGSERDVLLRWATVIGLLLMLGFASKMSGLYSRKLVMTWFALTPILICMAQRLASELVPALLSSAGTTRTHVIIGAGSLGHALAERLREGPACGAVCGFFDDRLEPGGRILPSLPILGRLQDAVAYVKRNSVDVVYIAAPLGGERRVVELIDGLRDTTASVYFVPDLLALDLIQPRVEQVRGMPVMALCETPMVGLNAVLKRCLDIALACVALLLLGPVMLAIAAAIRLESPGPALFRQRRYGMDGREFMVLKFRSMTVCEDGEHIVQATRADNRLTRLGAFLRRTSLDELPQFLNVLEGTMSVVGPRPHAVAHNEQYRQLISGYMIRHKVKPGITGWAQVNGLRGETSSVERMRMRVEHDLEYLRNWSAALDLWIVLRTVVVVFRDPNAY